MAKFIPVSAFDIVIFGATGDLSQRKLLPALFHRWLDDQIPADSRIIASARTQMSHKAYRAFAEEACRPHVDGEWDEAAWAGFKSLVRYHALDATDPGADWPALTADLNDDPERPRIFYLATHPDLYGPICKAIEATGLVTPGARVVLEKPIGTDLASAQRINREVCAVFDEQQIFRIDHYLGKETVQNLMVLRFANALLAPVWSREHIDHVQITVAESLGVGGRGDYYDRSGAVRDMVQNHILQLLCLTAMEPPSSLDGDDIRTEKIKVLKALAPVTRERAPGRVVRGRYAAGTEDGQPAVGYLEEEGIAADSQTETFIAIKAEIDNWRWAGVPFYLRTGKRMGVRHSDIVIQFKPVPHSIFNETSLQPNRLVLRLQPDEGVRLFLQIKEPGPGGLRVKSLPLNLSYAESFTVRYPDAYERLLMDVVRGNLALFMRRDEVEAAWAWVDGLLEACVEADLPMDEYRAGDPGPREAELMLDREGRRWWKGSA